MKRARILLIVSFISVLGLVFGWLAGPEDPGPRPASDPEPSMLRGSDTTGPDLPAGAGRPSVREVARPGIRLLPADPTHISGIVVNPSEEPVRGALCRILEGRTPTGLGRLLSRAEKGRKVVGSVVSDASGIFQIEVPEGFWALRVEAEGMSPWEEDSLRRGDFRWVRLGPARSLDVHVRDETEGPISGAKVQLLKGRYHDPRTARMTGRTNELGVANLASIPSGTWHLHVSHPDYVSAVHKLPPAGRPQSAFEVVLNRGTRIVGKVTLSDGRAPPFPARVLFETPDGFTSSHEVKSGPDGRYASRIVFPNTAYLAIEVAALVPGFGESRKEVTVGEPPSSGEIKVDFVLDSFERHVVGRVLNPHREPLSGVEVYLKPLLSLPPETLIRIPSDLEIFMNGLPDLGAYDPTPSLVARLRRAATSDNDGLFRIGGLHPRKSYNLLLISEEYSNAVLWVEEGDPGSVTDLGSIQLGPAGRVWGYVRRPDGSPIEGAQVQTAKHTHTDLNGAREFQTKRPEVLISLLDSISNSDGLFSIQPVPQADFLLLCLGTVFGPYSLPTGDTLGPIELISEETLRWERGISVVLSVIDQLQTPLDGLYAQMRRVGPIPGASEASRPSSIYPLDEWAFGDGSGKVHFKGLEAGTYEVTVKHLRGQFLDASLRIDLKNEDVFRDVILLPDPDPSVPLQGVVRDASDAPLAGVEVDLVAGGLACNCLRWTAQTDESGHFSFGRFMEGSHMLFMTHPEDRYPPARYYPARPGDSIVVTMK